MEHQSQNGFYVVYLDRIVIEKFRYEWYASGIVQKIAKFW
jgi:hypothetical protein